MREYFEKGCICLINKSFKKAPERLTDYEAYLYYSSLCNCTRNPEEKPRKEMISEMIRSFKALNNNDFCDEISIFLSMGLDRLMCDFHEKHYSLGFVADQWQEEAILDWHVTEDLENKLLTIFNDNEISFFEKHYQENLKGIFDEMRAFENTLNSMSAKDLLNIKPLSGIDSIEYSEENCTSCGSKYTKRGYIENELKERVKKVMCFACGHETKIEMEKLHLAPSCTGQGVSKELAENLKLSSFNLIGGQKFITLQLNGGYDFINFTRYNDNDLSYDSFKYNLSFCLRSNSKENQVINYYFNDIKLKFQDLEDFGLIHLIFKCESIVTLHDIELSFSDKNNSLLILDFLESVRDIILSDKGEFSLDLDHIRDIVINN